MVAAGEDGGRGWGVVVGEEGWGVGGWGCGVDGGEGIFGGWVMGVMS